MQAAPPFIAGIATPHKGARNDELFLAFPCREGGMRKRVG